MYLEATPGKQTVIFRGLARNIIHSGVDIKEFGFLPQLDDWSPSLWKPRSVPYCFLDHPTSSSPNDNGASHDDHRDGEQEKQCGWKWVISED